jgi:hypothetical protein
MARFASFNRGDAADTNSPAPARFEGPGGPGGFWNEPAANSLVTLDWHDRSPLEAAADLRRFGPVKVVPEDGTITHVFMSLKDATMDTAVAKLALMVNRNWAKFYVIDGRRMARPTQEEREQLAALPQPSQEERRQRFEQMASDPVFQQRMENRMLNGLKNSTPEQRVDRDKMRQQRRRQTAAR